MRPGGAQVVTLGDSYASGEGAPASAGSPWLTDAFGDSGADGCHRSVLSGHRQFGLQQGRGEARRYLNAACSGATVASLVSGTRGEPSQLDALGRGTRVITLSVGANDAGFSTVATACNTLVVVPGAPPCQVALAVASARLTALTTPGPGGVSALEGLYRTVLAEAPRAELLVTGYPLLFPAVPSAACFAIDPVAQQTLNALTVTANDAIEAATVRAGGTYVDLVPAFLGHSSCETDPTRSWINTVTLADPVRSFHPNAAGQAAIANALSDAFEALDA